jgi:hypothetical protein
LSRDLDLSPIVQGRRGEKGSRRRRTLIEITPYLFIRVRQGKRNVDQSKGEADKK